MLNQLNDSPLDLSRTRLRPIVHNGDLLVRTLREVSKCNCTGDWVEITADILLCVLDHIKSGSPIDPPFLHLKAVRVCPECLISVESVIHPPVDSDVFPLLIKMYWDSSKINIKLYQVIKELRKSNLNSCIFLFLIVHKLNGPLFQVFALFIGDIGFNFRISE